MKFFAMFFILFQFSLAIYGNKSDSLFRDLDKSNGNRSEYLKEKMNSLNELKLSLDTASRKEEQFQICRRLMNEYSNYISDSALYYSDKCLELSYELNNIDYQLDIKFKKSYLFCFSELFSEAFHIMDSINPEKLSDYYKAQYYRTYIFVYHNQIKDLNAQYYREKYKEIVKSYVEIYLALGEQNHIEYLAILAYKSYLYGHVQDLIHTTNLILNSPDIKPYVYAETLFNLGAALLEAGIEYRKEAKDVLIRASIEYNKLTLTRNPPLMYLARILMEENDSGRAYDYMNLAIEDVELFSNSHRHSIAGKTYAQIQKTYYAQIEKEKKVAMCLFTLITFLFLLLVIGQIILYRRNRTLKETRAELSSVILNLKEASHIKETYIAHYLNQYSDYITKMNNYRKTIVRKLQTGKHEQLLSEELKETSKKHHDVDILFSDFDQIFLGLYPCFVERVNTLLKEEEHYNILKSKKKVEVTILNTELRILALVKLGVTDNKVIASFLRITVQTLYNYRSKIKAKAINEESFEEDIKRIYK